MIDMSINFNLPRRCPAVIETLESDIGSTELDEAASSRKFLLLGIIHQQFASYVLFKLIFGSVSSLLCEHDCRL